MVDHYAPMRRRVARLARRWSSGTVTLTRSTPGTPEAGTPWIPGEPTLDLYALDARVDGVAAEYIDGGTILASDLMVIASAKARHTLHDGVAVAGTPYVDLEPAMADVLAIDGAVKVIKKIAPVPAGGAAARFNIVIGS